eukprot:1335754-Rhodomonas_salina.2
MGLSDVLGKSDWKVGTPSSPHGPAVQHLVLTWGLPLPGRERRVDDCVARLPGQLAPARSLCDARH